MRNAYTIDELTEPVVKKAYHNWLETVDFYYNQQLNLDAFAKFCSLFGVIADKCDVDDVSRMYIHVIDNDSLSGMNLVNFICDNFWSLLFVEKENDCFMTKDKTVYEKRKNPISGNDIDIVLLTPIYEYLYSVDSICGDDFTFEDLMTLCCNSWIEACAKQYNMNTAYYKFIDECREKSYIFLDNGDLIK